MNSKIFSLMLALPLLLTDTGYSFAETTNWEMFFIHISNLTGITGENAVVDSYLSRSHPSMLLARGGYRPKCRRTGTGCR